METMEEEEIWALKAQQNRFLEKRKEEERELCRLKEQQERISAEKERMKSHLQAQLLQNQNGDTEALLKIINRHSGGDPSEVNEDLNILNTSYLLELLPSVINSLRQENFPTEDTERAENGKNNLTHSVNFITNQAKPCKQSKQHCRGQAETGINCP